MSKDFDWRISPKAYGVESRFSNAQADAFGRDSEASRAYARTRTAADFAEPGRGVIDNRRGSSSAGAKLNPMTSAPALLKTGPPSRS